ncbi:MAG: TetR/AcrR family transcriptional regulator [Ilumatobacteraceae bacterium]
MTGSDPRQELLDAAVEYVAEHGLADLSLRRLASELGTSHRMLSHHFGSKDGMWAAIVNEVEHRQLAAFGDLGSDPSMSFEDVMRAWWRHLSDPALSANERLFFEVYVNALRDQAASAEFLAGAVESWLAPATGRLEAMGVSPERASAHARLGLAVTRGLLLDLLATGDRTAVDVAMEQWIALSAELVSAGGPRAALAPRGATRRPSAG